MPSRTAVVPERAITSGASRGFTVLLLGGAVQPLVGTALPAFGTRPGKLFGPVRTRFGWNVGVVEAVDPGRTMSLDESSETLAQVLLGEWRSEAWQEWIADRARRRTRPSGTRPVARPARSLGTSNGERLVPTWMEQEKRASRAAVNRRGAVLCQVLAWVFLAISVVVVFLG